MAHVYARRVVAEDLPGDVRENVHVRRRLRFVRGCAVGGVGVRSLYDLLQQQGGRQLGGLARAESGEGLINEGVIHRCSSGGSADGA